MTLDVVKSVSAVAVVAGALGLADGAADADGADGGGAGSVGTPGHALVGTGGADHINKEIVRQKSRLKKSASLTWQVDLRKLKLLICVVSACKADRR